MDFGLVGFDHLASRNPPQESQKWGGSEFLKQEMGINEEEEEEDPFRGFKVAKTCTYGSHWTGMESGRGPFSPSQWMELEHQALIYKYISSNVPIPCHLLNPIRKAFQSAACYPGLFPAGLRSNSLGWGGLHLGYNSGDPEPGRCRRTDGKKWRCSREAVAEGKYCERHMNRGRHRSRKPVEGQTGHSSTNASNAGKAIHPQFNTLQSDNGHGRGQDSKSQTSLRQFVDYWPDAALQPDRATQLSISIPMATPESTKGKLSSSQELEMGLGVGNFANEQRQATNWVPISWESPIGGPLGEVVHIAGDAKNAKPLNLMDSGKKLEGGNRCNGFKGPGAVMNPSLRGWQLIFHGCKRVCQAESSILCDHRFHHFINFIQFRKLIQNENSHKLDNLNTTIQTNTNQNISRTDTMVEEANTHRVRRRRRPLRCGVGDGGGACDLRYR